MEGSKPRSKHDKFQDRFVRYVRYVLCVGKLVFKNLENVGLWLSENKGPKKTSILSSSFIFVLWQNGHKMEAHSWFFGHPTESNFIVHLQFIHIHTYSYIFIYIHTYSYIFIHTVQMHIKLLIHHPVICRFRRQVLPSCHMQGRSPGDSWQRPSSPGITEPTPLVAENGEVYPLVI